MSSLANAPIDTTRIFRSEEELAALPASERIRYRLVTADRRFHANDNIAGFIAPGELEELHQEVESRRKPSCS